MRIVKEHDVRQKEILDTAEAFFASKGYQKTTVNDILNRIGIAKGTFYHYFKSKEEVLDAVIDRVIEGDLEAAAKIVSDDTLKPPEKLYRIFFMQKYEPSQIKQNITAAAHKPDNAEMHLKTMSKTIDKLSPVLAEIVVQGIQTGDFKTPYPREVIDFLLVSGQFLFDDALFNWQEEEKSARTAAFIHTMELLLGAQTGSFAYMGEILASE